MQKSQDTLSNSKVEILLRREDSSSNKMALKEKFVAVYESFFKGEDPSAGNPNFWPEVLLLKVNISFLERCVILTTEEQLVALKDNICNIFLNCSKAITDHSTLRAAHALETITILVRSIFRKRFNNFGSDVITILCGIDRADSAFKELLISLKSILDGSEIYMKDAVLNLLLVIITAVDNINQNTLFEYLMLVDFFECLMKIIADPTTHTSTAFNVLLLLVILSNYQKYEVQNPYIKQLSSLNDDKSLKAIGSVLTEICASLNREFILGIQEPVGVLSRVSGFLSGFMRSQDTPTTSVSGTTSVGVFLLALYELVHLNIFFVTVVLAMDSNVKRSPSESEISPRVSPRQPFSPQCQSASAPDSLPAPSSTPQVHSGLIQHFLTFSSFLFAGDMKDVKAASYAKLCVLITVCLAENAIMCKTLHSPQCVSTVLYIMKDEKIIVNVLPPGVSQVGEKQALACATLDVVNIFMKQNLKKNRFSSDMYSRSVGVVHRMLSYEKKVGVRLSYKWKEIWNTLFMVIKFISGEPTLLQLQEVQFMCVQIVTIFNLFITYGDTFLPSPSDYDDLYYELMRVSKMLDQFYTLVERLDVGGSIVMNLQNINTIIVHFSGKIEQWSQLHQEVTITPDQVLKVIKENYDSLKLKLQENLDYYDGYIENPKEVPFFRQLTRMIVFDLKQTLVVSPIKLPNIVV